MAYTIAELNEIYGDKEYEDLTQCERILKKIAEIGFINAHIAMTELGIYRLAARIKDLERRGYDIVGTMESGRNRYNEKTSFKVYRLAEKEGNTDDQ
jgi:hypothetical protein